MMYLQLESLYFENENHYYTALSVRKPKYGNHFSRTLNFCKTKLWQAGD